MKVRKLLVAGVLALSLQRAVAAGDVVVNTAPAESVETPAQLAPVVVTDSANKPAVPANVPSSSEGVTAKQIAESVNSLSSAGALLYLPSVHVRERFIGDVNGGLAIRKYSYNESAGTIVYADGLLLSNFLNNSCCPGPRWSMVPQEAIDRVDIMYGPFSALYPGNSVGGVVLMTTRMPAKLEAHAKLDMFSENFKLYGTDKNFPGQHGVVTVGNKIGDWSFRLSADHLDNHSHPTDFTAAVAKTGAPAAAGTYTVVTGAQFDVDKANNARVTTAAISIDHTVKDDGMIKLAYDFSPTVRASYTFDVWQNKSDKLIDSYLRDAAGNTIYGTSTVSTSPFRYVRIDGKDYSVTAPSVSHADSDYRMHGLSAKSDSGGPWDWEVTASYFNQNKDVTRASSGNNGTTPSTAATAGTVTFGDGTGWQNLDMRGDWRPDGNAKSTHQVSFGFHTDTYRTKSDQYNLATGNWQTSGTAALNTNSRGVTSTEAIYLQDAWQISPQLKLVAGGREEKWRASRGSNFASGKHVSYGDRSVTAFSPKASLAYQASENLALRGSYGRGTRFPTVGELFKNIGITHVGGGAATPAEIASFQAPYNVALTNNPTLKPEAADSWELTAERFLANGVWRTSLFGEEKKDALFSQADLTSLPGYSISSVQNLDKTRTYGIETSFEANDLWLRGLDVSGSAAYLHATIVKDAANPGLEGTLQPLVPKWRAALSAVYHASDDLSVSLGWRYSGRQHDGLFNTTTHQYNDPNSNVYGGRSTFSIFDTKLLYKFAKQWTASVGIDNIGNVKYFTLYPYSQRTYFASIKFDN